MSINLDSNEINKPIGDYFKYKPGNKLISKDKETFFIKKKDPSIIKIKINSFRGFSVGATHYYCTINYWPIYICNTSNCIVSGKFLEEFNMEVHMYIRLVRKITKKDYEKNSMRWNEDDIGLYTDCFNSINDIYKKLILFLKKYCLNKKIILENFGDDRKKFTIDNLKEGFKNIIKEEVI